MSEVNEKTYKVEVVSGSETSSEALQAFWQEAFRLREVLRVRRAEYAKNTTEPNQDEAVAFAEQE